MTIKVGTANEIKNHTQLNMDIADDRILASALHLNDHYSGSVYVATTEFAMFAKAAGLGLNGIHLERLAETTSVLTRRERSALKTHWTHVEVADSPWALCRRVLALLNLNVAERLLQPVRSSGQPPELAAVLQQYDRLRSEWGPDVNLNTLLQPIFGIAPPRPANLEVAQVTEYRPREPSQVWAFSSPTVRSESDEERAIRIRGEQRAYDQRNEFIRDSLLIGLELVKEFLSDVVDDDLFA